MSPTYRPDIDGLRAVAIVPVVLFHLHVAGFGGGYVGVDVFFVISGYLITSLIHPDIAAGTFSLTRFFARRARRLFPALFLVLGFTTLAAHVLMTPPDLRSFSQSLSAATLFTANALFWRRAGYFELPAETKPLLHTWSLSVEEQFYLFFPVGLLLLHRFLPRRVAAGVALAASLSFLGCILVNETRPDAVFYLPMFRAWELLLGVLLGLGVVPPIRSARVRELVALAGLGGIVFAVYLLSEESLFPGATALPPTLGAAFLIHAGSSGSTRVGRILSSRGLVFLGLISYPLYLWHWPLSVFARYSLTRDLLLSEATAIVAASVLLATLTWRFVELPIRRTSAPSKRVLIAAAGTAAAVFVIVGRLGDLGYELPGRLTPQARAILVAGVADRRMTCWRTVVDVPLIERACRLGVEGTPSFVLWGDSHAHAMEPVMDSIADARGAAGLMVGHPGCAPLVGLARNDRSTACRTVTAEVVELLRSEPSIRRVVLVSRWALRASGTVPDGGIEPWRMDGRENEIETDFRLAVERTIGQLDRLGLEVVFVTQVPEVGWNVPRVLARPRLFGAPPDGPSLAAYRLRQRPVDAALAALPTGYNLRVLDVAAILCPGERCVVQRDGLPLYRDDNHPSTHGARALAPLLGEALAGLEGASPAGGQD